MSALHIQAMLSKIVFQSDDSSFVVAEFIDAQSAKRFRATGKYLTIGKTDAHQHYKLFGNWEKNPKYGDTFSVVFSEPAKPTSVKGLIPFLANNIKGIGEATAKKLVEQTAAQSVEDLIKICSSEPERIFAILKSKKTAAERVISIMTGDDVYRSIMIFLHEHNIPTKFSQKIFQKYGSEAVDLLTQNPYRLIWDFRNVGFLRADAVALKLGIGHDSLFRVEAALIYCLESALNEGHCCLPRDVLISRSCQALGAKEFPAITPDFVLTSLRQIYKRNKTENTQRFVIRQLENETYFYLPEVLFREDSVCAQMKALLHKTFIGAESLEEKLLKKEITLESLAPDLQWQRLSEEQKSAVEQSALARVMILTGGPGCGKTFVLKAIYQLQRALKRKVALCAPTGLAAKRMSQSIGVQAFTVHKLLKLGRASEQTQSQAEILANGTGLDDNGVDAPSLASPVGAGAVLEGVDVVIVDESSMLSLELLHVILQAMGPRRRLILVGDQNQLPSVGAGNCLRDLIQSQCIPVVKLTKIFRQSSESPIPAAAKQMIEGTLPDFTLKSRTAAFARAEKLAFIETKIEDFQEHLVQFFKSSVPGLYGLDPLRDCQILIPMKKGDAGGEALNKLMQSILNPLTADKAETNMGGWLLREGDKVMQTRNNYTKEVFNGDLGRCTAVKITSEKREAEICFVDKTVTLEDDELDDLQLSYAITIHKSQGSEFPLCVIPIFSSYYSMLDRNLFYTALTRASGFGILMGEEWALKKAVRTQDAVRRYTCLEALMRLGSSCVH